MKVTKFTNLLVFALALTVAVAGCRKRPDYVTKIPQGAKTGPGDMSPSKPLEGGDNPTSKEGRPEVNPDKYKDYIPHPEILQKDTVYFDFDSSVVKASEKSKLSSVADYMKANTADALRIEGHCDERGTEEYNRALGSRRASALREELATMGVGADRIVTESFGKDRPAVPGHNEAAWKLNRRGEFIVLTPPK